MIDAGIFAALHYLGAMVMFGCLLVEHMLLQPEMEADTLRRLGRIDLMYGMTALAQVASGATRMFTEKGLDYYLHQPLFHGKVGLFLIIGLMSVYPTINIIQWRRELERTASVMPPAPTLRRTITLVRLQLVLVLCLPLLAALMARGVSMGR